MPPTKQGKTKYQHPGCQKLQHHEKRRYTSIPRNPREPRVAARMVSLLFLWPRVAHFGWLLVVNGFGSANNTVPVCRTSVGLHHSSGRADCSGATSAGCGLVFVADNKQKKKRPDWCGYVLGLKTSGVILSHQSKIDFLHFVGVAEKPQTANNTVGRGSSVLSVICFNLLPIFQYKVAPLMSYMRSSHERHKKAETHKRHAC